MSDPQSQSQKLLNILENKTFDGFNSPELQAIGGTQARFRLVQRLITGGVVEASPFPVELALIRAIHIAKGNRALVPNSKFVEQLRFGVTASHMNGVKEISFGELQDSISQIEFRRDVALSREDTGRNTIIEWLAYAFYKMPLEMRDPLWDLFEMDDYDVHNDDQLFYPSFDTLREGMSQVPVPIIVGKNRNKARVEAIRKTHGECPVIGMDHMGATISLILFFSSGDPTTDAIIFPLLGRGKRLREGEDGAPQQKANPIWIVLAYNPPPIVRESSQRNAFQFS
jgi:hypothetical protein